MECHYLQTSFLVYSLIINHKLMIFTVHLFCHHHHHLGLHHQEYHHRLHHHLRCHHHHRHHPCDQECHHCHHHHQLSPSSHHHQNHCLPTTLQRPKLLLIARSP